jgi:signal transduction histidine kinase
LCLVMPSETSTASADQSVEELRRELAEAQAERDDAHRREAATAEVLRVISKCTTDVQPVFDAIVMSSKLLLGAHSALVSRVVGRELVLAAYTPINPTADDELKGTYPHSLEGTGLAVYVVREGVPCVVSDTETDDRVPPSVRETARSRGFRSILSVPMLSRGEAIGTINVTRATSGAFSDKDIALLQTFADQAVIAIENTRLFEEVQARTKELTESLESETATSDILNVISRSPTDLQPVFDTIAANAVKLCSADRALIYRFDGEFLRLAASYNAPPELREFIERNPFHPGRGSTSARAALEQRTVQILDLQADPEYAYGARDVVPIRSTIAVPMLKGEALLGVITIYRLEVRPFTDKQISLVETFADQASIAISNVGLFEEVQARTRELTEALDQQTATADVLKVISRSALDVQKVLDALVESAARLCDAYDAAIFQVFGDGLRLVAHNGQIPFAGPVGQYTMPLVRGRVPGRAVIDQRTIHITDMLTEANDYPESRRRALQQGWRTGLAVPLVHAGEAIGVIIIRRAEVRQFTERQIELVNTFADQAVIAIENTRLFEEVEARTRELAKTVEDLEIASQHKSQFVANMSHELRTPLAAILGYAELMQEGFYGNQSDKSMDALTRIRSNGKHLLGLINTVLDIAKIESGQFTLNMAEYAIESVVETVRSATESLAQNKKLALKTQVAKSLPIGLGDEQRLTQVLLNLVGNAIKFTDTGEVRVTAKAVNGHFNVSVTDTGPGIPLAHQARIFEQFHQVDSSNTKAKGGTGLGLAIAKQIVEMHGGRIWVESTLGQGSTFQMELPTRAELRKPAS